MLLGEPPRTNYDLHFKVAGIPVRVHPFFWVIAVVLGARGDTPPESLLVWVAVVFISILIHELGHALVIRRCGWRPWITLHSFGGLASYEPTYHDAKKQIAISAAGPGAGFLFAGAIILLLYLTGHYSAVVLPGPAEQEPLFVGGDHPLPNKYLGELVFDLLFVNIYWGVLNLFPVLPLDGGQIARELLLVANPSRGIHQSFMLSTFTAAGLAVFMLIQGSLFTTILFGLLAYGSYTSWQQYTGRGGGFGGFGGGWGKGRFGGGGFFGGDDTERW